MNLPFFEFEKVSEHFLLGNTDKSCFQAWEGNIQIVGDKFRKKHNKKDSDSKDSITVLCSIGNAAAGGQGTWKMLMEDEEVLPQSLSDENLIKQYGAPEGSMVVFTPSAYMTDEAYG